MLGLKGRQADYVQAFPQAPLDDPVFIQIPQGWKLDSTTGKLVRVEEDPAYRDSSNMIRLRRNLYGCKQASRNLYLHLTAGLTSRGFTQSTVDPCLYIRHDCIIILYTDDCCVFAHDSSVIKAVIADLAQDFVLKDEGEIEDFLGIHVTKTVGTDDTTRIEMTQTGLINSILQDVGLHDNDPKTKRTPAADILHPSDTLNLPFDAHWNYRSVIGKLNFLAQNTRPDIAFAVHQCARYCSAPRKIHQIAVKYLCR